MKSRSGRDDSNFKIADLVPSKFLRYLDQIDTFIRDNSRNDDKRDYPEESIKRDCPQKSTNCGPQHAAPSELVTISGSCLEIIIERGPDGLDLLNVYDTLANFLQGVSCVREYLVVAATDGPLRHLQVHSAKRL